MSRNGPLALLASLAVLLTTLVGVRPAAADEGDGDRPLRVLITGDSITQGFHGDYTWRYRLYKEFVRQGVPVDFVGSRSTPYVNQDWPSADYADPDFDSDHFAWVGRTLLELSRWVQDEVTAQQPDLIVLAAGVNDLRRGDTPEQAIEHLESWLDRARAAQPGVDVVISPVLGAADSTRPWLPAAITTYGGLLRDLVPTLSTSESRVTLADTTRGWSYVSETFDNLHPTPTGEALIAQRIAENLRTRGVLPQAPTIYRVIPWTRTEKVGVATHGTRAVLTWRSQATTSMRLWLRRQGHDASYPKTLFKGGTLTTAPLAAGQVYDARVQLVRGRVVGPLGPTTRFRVPAPPKPPAVARVVVSAGGVRWTRVGTATSYVVRFRQAGHKKWVRRTPTATYVRAKRVKVAQVWAANAGGLSPMRSATR